MVLMRKGKTIVSSFPRPPKHLSPTEGSVMQEFKGQVLKFDRCPGLNCQGGNQAFYELIADKPSP